MRAGCAVFGSGELPARFRRVNLGMEQKFYRPPHVNFFPTIKGDWLRQPPRRPSTFATEETCHLPGPLGHLMAARRS